MQRRLRNLQAVSSRFALFGLLAVLAFGLAPAHPLRAQEPAPNAESTVTPRGSASPLAARAQPLDLDELAGLLQDLFGGLMRVHGVAGAQAYIFDESGGRSVTAGFANADETRPINADTLFQAGELARPYTAWLALQALAQAGAGEGGVANALRQPRSIEGFPVRNAAGEEKRVTLHQLLTMSSGLPASRAGFVQPEEPRQSTGGAAAPPAPDAFLRERLVLGHEPGEAIAVAPENYALVARLLEELVGQDFAELAAAGRETAGLQGACTLREQCPEDAEFARPVIYAGKGFYEMPRAELLFPAADSLHVSARDYGRFLEQLAARAFQSQAVRRAGAAGASLEAAQTYQDSLEAELFRNRFAYHPDLGGMSYGFHELRPANPVGEDGVQAADLDNPGLSVFQVQGRQPGYGAFAFVTPQGRGAVILTNSDQPALLRAAARWLFQRYGILDFEPNEAAMDYSARDDYFDGIEGFYRPEHSLPGEQAQFDFLNEIRLGRARRGLEFAGVFQKDTAIFLHALGPQDLFIARGQARMDGWRARIERNAEGEAIAVATDLIRYEKRPAFLNAWATIVALGLAFGSPILLFLLYLIFRKRGSGGTTDMASVAARAAGMKRVVIVGAGFAGINAARQLSNRKGVHVTIIDRRNHHLFQPLLYQVAMAALSPADIATPIRSVLRKSKNIDILLGNVMKVDFANRKVIASFGDIDYDYLILACGANHSYFGHNEWEEFAPGLKSIEEATEIRRRILLAFEMAEREQSAATQKEFLTFVVVGGGPTGVELAGALGEISRYTVTRDFRRIDPRNTRVILVEGGPRILPTFDSELSAKAQRGLEKLGVTVWTNSIVTDVRPDGVQVGDEFIKARTVLWAAGVAPAEINKELSVERDRGGRLVVNEDCSVPGHPEVFVLGDQASFQHGTERPLPGVATVAIQQGSYAARLILDELRGKPRKPFKFFDKGYMATIGRADAVVESGPIKFGGFIAWLAWLVVHIFFLIGFRNRVAVFLQWAYSYLTFARGARLITSRNWQSDKRFDLARRYLEIFEERMAARKNPPDNTKPKG